MSLKPAEWLLLHAGIAVGTAAVVFALHRRQPADAGWSALLLGGALVPWVFLGFKRSRRLKAFNGQLAGRLQLMAGSLQAGLSLAQALDTVVREGTRADRRRVPPRAGRDPARRPDRGRAGVHRPSAWRAPTSSGS